MGKSVDYSYGPLPHLIKQLYGSSLITGAESGVCALSAALLILKKRIIMVTNKDRFRAARVLFGKRTTVVLEDHFKEYLMSMKKSLHYFV